MDQINNFMFLWIGLVAPLIGLLLAAVGILKLRNRSGNSYARPDPKHFVVGTSGAEFKQRVTGVFFSSVSFVVLMVLSQTGQLGAISSGVLSGLVIFSLLSLSNLYYNLHVLLWRIEVSGNDITFSTLWRTRYFSYHEIESVIENDYRRVAGVDPDKPLKVKLYAYISFTYGKSISLDERKSGYDLLIEYFKLQDVGVYQLHLDEEDDDDDSAYAKLTEMENSAASLAPRKLQRRKILPLVFVLLIFSVLILILEFSRPESIIFHDDGFEINLFRHVPISEIFSPAGGYFVSFEDIIEIELMPYSATELGRMTDGLNVPAYRPGGNRPRRTAAGYFDGVRMHVDLAPNSSHTLWITRSNGSDILISHHASGGDEWIDWLYRRIMFDLRRLAAVDIADVPEILEQILGNQQVPGELVTEEALTAQAIRALVVAYNQGRDGEPPDYEMAVYWLRHGVELEDDWAMRNLGVMYFNGDGVEQDKVQALYWLTRAANYDNVHAQTNLSWILRQYEDVRDYDLAAYWTRRAAENGDRGAMNVLGHMYANARGVELDYDASYYWFIRSADLGYGMAMRNVGLMYEHGIGREIDLAEAKYWFSKSAEAGHDIARYDYQRVAANERGQGD